MSDAEKIRRRLEQELLRPVPDDDIVYTLRQRLDYADTVDHEKLNRGSDKLNRSSLNTLLGSLGATHE